jgi:hypothetical protein
MDYDSNRFLAHAVLLLLGNMLNVSHAAIGRVVTVFDAGPGLAFTYGRRMLFARELPPSCIPAKVSGHHHQGRCTIPLCCLAVKSVLYY